MAGWFQTFLLLSAVGSLLTGILLITKKWARKYFPPLWQYVLWIGVLLVMVVPISIKIPVVVQPVLEKNIENTLLSTPIEMTTTNVPISHNTTETHMEETFSVTQEVTSSPFLWWDLLALIWILGIFGTLGYRLVGYKRFVKYIRRIGEPIALNVELPKRLHVYKTKEAVSPMVTGILHPILILPEDALKESRLSYVLRHELIHYRRGDLIWRWLAVLAMSIHWFNPVVYVATAQMQEACEISCDWCVVQHMEQAKRDDYMRVILELLAMTISKKQILTTQMTSEKKQLQRRFSMIRNQKAFGKKKIFFSVCVGTMLLSGAWLTGCALQETYVQREAETKIATDIEGLAEEGTLLFVGTDNNGRADTIFTYRMSESKGKAYIVAIPRDTKTADGQKISSLLVQENGDAKLIQAVSEITTQPVADYVRMDLTAIETVIDTLDGITFDVPQNMDYEDSVQDLSIHLKAGEQVLSGNDALGLLRYRQGYPQQDLSRIEVQQAFLQEMFQQKCNPAYLKEIPEILETTKGHVVTNLTITDIAEYGKKLYECKQKGIDTLKLYTLQEIPVSDNRIV